MHSVNELLDGCHWRVTVNVEGLSNRRCLFFFFSPKPLSFLPSSSFLDGGADSSPSEILLFSHVTLCSPSDFLIRRHISIHHRSAHVFLSNSNPPLSFLSSSPYSLFSSVVILYISRHFALRDTESYLAESYCSYQGHTAPIIKKKKKKKKEAELLLCKTQI